MRYAVGISLAIIMVLDFLVMYFNRWIMKVPGLLLVLKVLGAVPVFMQSALAVETILLSRKDLGVIITIITVHAAGRLELGS